MGISAVCRSTKRIFAKNACAGGEPARRREGRGFSTPMMTLDVGASVRRGARLRDRARSTRPGARIHQAAGSNSAIYRVVPGHTVHAADMATQVEAARHLVYAGSRAVDAGVKECLEDFGDVE